MGIVSREQARSATRYRQYNQYKSGITIEIHMTSRLILSKRLMLYIVHKLFLIMVEAAEDSDNIENV